MMDVVHWIGAPIGTILYHRILDSTYTLIDVNHTHLSPIRIDNGAEHSTLQSVGCWPSGRLQLQPSSSISSSSSTTTTSTTHDVNNTTYQQHFQNIQMGTSRGLATGATSSDDE
jgi:hypothetical protein